MTTKGWKTTVLQHMFVEYFVLKQLIIKLKMCYKMYIISLGILIIN